MYQTPVLVGEDKLERIRGLGTMSELRTAAPSSEGGKIICFVIFDSS